MSVEGNIVTTLRTIAPAHPLVAPEGSALPRFVFQQVGGQAVSFMDRALPKLQNGRFQIAAWAQTSVEASQLALAAETALRVATLFQATPLGAPVAVLDEDTGLHGRLQDFSIWSDRPAT